MLANLSKFSCTPAPLIGTLLDVMVTGVDGDVLIAEALSAD
jgi:hypothetical protein